MATPTDSMAPDQLHAEMQLLLNGPAGSPPAGVLPHVQDPSNLDTYLIVTLTLCIALATVTFCLRMYTKRFLIRSIAYEDCKLTESAPNEGSDADLTRCYHNCLGELLPDTRLRLFADSLRLAKWRRPFLLDSVRGMAEEAICGTSRSRSFSRCSMYGLSLGPRSSRVTSNTRPSGSTYRQ